MEKNISWTFKQRQQYLHRRWVSVYSSSMHLLRFTDLCSLPPLHFSIGHWKVKCFNESPIDMIALDSKSDVIKIVWINRAIQQMHWYVATHALPHNTESRRKKKSIDRFMGYNEECISIECNLQFRIIQFICLQYFSVWKCDIVACLWLAYRHTNLAQESIINKISNKHRSIRFDY